jgi:hypothetical protein
MNDDKKYNMKTICTPAADNTTTYRLINTVTYIVASDEKTSPPTDIIRVEPALYIFAKNTSGFCRTAIDATHKRVARVIQSTNFEGLRNIVGIPMKIANRKNTIAPRRRYIELVRRARNSAVSGIPPLNSVI